MSFSKMGCIEEMIKAADIHPYQVIYVHPKLIEKDHRDSCPSCQFALAGMTLFVDIVKDQERPKIDEY